MRNLKKFLALVLAMMMTLSLMVTVNAAANTDFKDDGEINAKFAEAAEVLTGMGILKGYKAEDGSVSFKPEQKVTRAEMAALVYRLASGDADEARAYLYVGGSSFTDVPEGKWYDGVVGYCATYGIIAGVGNNRFNPTGDVTGYQALAMILRAVGYDQNKEFTDNPTWQSNVASVATVEGLLKNVSSTSYAGKLSQPATRELIAEFLFQGAQIPTVTWTMLGGYNKTDSILGSGKQNPSLGEKGYGLTCHYGIVLGNQATGEDVTKIGFETNASDAAENPGKINDNGSYKYADTSASSGTPGNTTLSFDYTTGLEKFGHKVKVWYNADSGATKDTYAVSDEAELAVTVAASSNDIDDTSTDGALGKVLKAEGFDIANSTGYYPSASFARIGTATGAMTSNPDAPTSKVYVAISNNGDKTVDVVIPVDCYATQIIKVDNYAKAPTITLLTNASLGSSGKITQEYITSPKENNILGGKVIITKISKSTADDSTNLYWIDNVTKTEKGTVVKVDKTKQTVTLQDGRTLKRTIIANDAIDESANGATFNVDNNDTGKGTQDGDFAYAEYTFLVDGQGNWLHATREYGTRFVYGTYVDYTTEWGSSTFNFRLVGVEVDGTPVTVDFNKLNNVAMTATALKSVGSAPASTINNSGNGDVKNVYYHDNTSNKTIGMDYAGYMGFAVDDNGNLWSEQTADQIKPSKLDPDFARITTNFAATTISKSDLALGVKEVAHKDGGSNHTNLYLTEHTKFIVVGGYGTDTQEVTVYNGLTELLDGADSVTINKWKGAAAPTSMGDANEDYMQQMWVNTSDYIYAAVTGSENKQVNTIFLPKAAIERATNVNDLYYVKNGNESSSIVEPDVASSPAGLYTLHRMGEEVQVWLKSSPTGMAADKFFTLKDTGKETTTGEKIYDTVAVTSGAPGTATIKASEKIEGTYKTSFVGATNNGQTAVITYNNNTAVVGTANVVVKSLTDKTTVTNIDQLNDLASVHTTIQVALQYAEAGSNMVSCIYVIDVDPS